MENTFDTGVKYDYQTYTNGLKRSFDDGVSSFADWLVENKVISKNIMKELLRDYNGGRNNV